MNTQEELQGLYNYYAMIESCININWDKGLSELRQRAKECFALLFYISKMIEYRENERVKKSTRKRTDALQEIIKEKNPINSIDDAYSEIESDSLLMCKVYEDIMKPDFIKYPHDLRHNLRLYMAYAIALDKSFASLINKEPLVKVAHHLQENLNSLYISFRDTHDSFFAEEKEGDRNSKNSSTRTPAKIEDCKKHDLYPQLEQMIKSYRETSREIRKLNEIVGEIIGTDNRVTIKRYRYLFFQEIQKG